MRFSSGFLLCLDGELHGLFFTHVVSRPEPLHEIETEMPPNSFLDYLALALSGSGGTHLDGSQDLFIDRQGGPRLCHTHILAS